MPAEGSFWEQSPGTHAAQTEPRRAAPGHQLQPPPPSTHPENPTLHPPNLQLSHRLSSLLCRDASWRSDSIGEFSILYRHILV